MPENSFYDLIGEYLDSEKLKEARLRIENMETERKQYILCCGVYHCLAAGETQRAKILLDVISPYLSSSDLKFQTALLNVYEVSNDAPRS